jgi:hypothetical protein
VLARRRGFSAPRHGAGNLTCGGSSVHTAAVTADMPVTVTPILNRVCSALLASLFVTQAGERAVFLVALAGGQAVMGHAENSGLGIESVRAVLGVRDQISSRQYATSGFSSIASVPNSTLGRLARWRAVEGVG